MGATIATQDATALSSNNKSLSKKEIRSKFLSDFKGRIDLALDKLYLFYGRPYDFNSPGGVLPDPIDSVNDDSSIRKAIMALKLIEPLDVRLAFKRNDWVTNTTTFTQYSDQTNLENANPAYYTFVKSQDKLYICLDNNNGAVSVTEPNSSDSTPFTTADGYKWKLLIAYESSLIRKFSATTHLPVPDAGEQIKTSNKGGVIERLELKDDSPQTIDYSDASPLLSEVPLFIKGDGDDVRTGRASIATIEATTLVSATITNAGTGYHNDITRSTVPVEFRLTDPSSAVDNTPFKLAYGLATISNGTITALEVINSGSGYPASGTLTIVQSSAIAYATLDSSTNRIASSNPFVIVQAGEKFRTAKVISVAGNAVSDAEDADIYIQPILSPFGGHGSNLQLELSATSLFVNVKVSAEAGGVFTQSNDFRQIGIISNVQHIDPTLTLVGSQLDATTSANIVERTDSLFTNIATDATIEGRTSLHKANLVDITATGTGIETIRYLNSQDVPYTNTFNDTEVVDFNGGTGNGFTVSNITKPTIDIFSGAILFINNNDPIQRASGQTETLNFIFNF